MSRILCTFPGKVGDILWALPTVRAISEGADCKVDVCYEDNPGAVPAESRLDLLLMAQPYIDRAFKWDQWEWLQRGEHPQRCARLYPSLGGYSNVIHLGYVGWPAASLAGDIAYRAEAQRGGVAVDLSRPWILPPPNTGTWAFSAPNYSVVVGFSDEWAELKAGLMGALAAADLDPLVLVPPGGSRLAEEWANSRVNVDWYKCDLREAARIIANCSVFVGCLSSLAVLAAAMGKPRVLVEPSVARHNPIFQHWDTELVKGNDGLPTTDARAVVAAVKAKLESL